MFAGAGGLGYSLGGVVLRQMCAVLAAQAMATAANVGMWWRPLWRWSVPNSEIVGYSRVAFLLVLRTRMLVVLATGDLN